MVLNGGQKWDLGKSNLIGFALGSHSESANSEIGFWLKLALFGFLANQNRLRHTALTRTSRNRKVQISDSCKESSHAGMTVGDSPTARQSRNQAAKKPEESADPSSKTSFDRLRTGSRDEVIPSPSSRRAGSRDKVGPGTRR